MKFFQIASLQASNFLLVVATSVVVQWRCCKQQSSQRDQYTLSKSISNSVTDVEAEEMPVSDCQAWNTPNFLLATSVLVQWRCCKQQSSQRDQYTLSKSISNSVTDVEAEEMPVLMPFCSRDHFSVKSSCSLFTHW